MEKSCGVRSGSNNGGQQASSNGNQGSVGPRAVDIEKPGGWNGVRWERPVVKFTRDSSLSAPADITTAKPSFTLGDAEFSTVGYPDPNNVYLVQMHGSYWEKKLFTFDLGKDGVPNKIEAETENTLGDLAVQTFASAAAVGRAYLKSMGGGANANVNAPPDNGDGCNQWNTMTDAERSFANSLPGLRRELFCWLPSTERSDFRFRMSAEVQWNFALYAVAEGDTWAGFDDQLIYEFLGVFAVFDRLQEYEKKIAELSVGVNLPEAATVEVIDKLIANAEARRNELRARFFGTQSKKTWWTAHLEVTPEEGTSLSKFKLLEYDREAGACNLPSPQTGVNVRLVTDPPKYSDCGDQARKQTVLASVTKDGGDFAEKAGAHFASGITPEARYGLFYRVPSQSTVRLYERPATATVSDSFARTRVSIALYGKVVALPESTGVRNTK
jgi:hypothetical protein